MADTNTYISKQKVEKWTTKEKFNAFDLSTIETGTEYNLTGAIEESDLGSDLQTKINGKLTAPINPSAESAITMLADGTVGTKLLSEMRKLYNHKLYFQTAGEYTLVWINLITSSDTAYTQPSQFISLINKIPANVIEPSFEGIVEANGSTAADGTLKITLRGSGVNNSEVQPVAAAISITIDASTFVNDTVIEL